MSLREQMIDLARRAKAASRMLAGLESAAKDDCLRAMAWALEANRMAIMHANAQDLDGAAKAGLSAAMLDRLRLDEGRVSAMARGLRELVAQADPVNRVLEERVRPNGLRLRKVTVPFGVVVIIYESRPNVTADAAGLCLKSGNAVILRGGKEALLSNRIIAEVMVAAAKNCCDRFPADAIQVVTTSDREAIPELLSLTRYVDLCMPRGGEGLIRAVTECSKVPVIKHYKGVCHVFVDRAADLAMAEEIVLNAKLQRAAVCNAMETLLVDRPLAEGFLLQIAAKLAAQNVELHVDPAAHKRLAGKVPRLKQATREDWSTEYNDYVLNLGVVDGVDAAIEHINEHGSNHSDTIVTADPERAQRFLDRVDSAAVYWNASTRFTDGGEFGMGAEIGISTDKVGARGPMGLEELTTYKWLGYGTGQIRT